MPEESIGLNAFDRNGDSSFTMRNMQKIHDLRMLARSIEERLSTLENVAKASPEEIFRERVMLKTTQKEIQRLERKSLLNEFIID